MEREDEDYNFDGADTGRRNEVDSNMAMYFNDIKGLPLYTAGEEREQLRELWEEETMLWQILLGDRRTTAAALRAWDGFKDKILDNPERLRHTQATVDELVRLRSSTRSSRPLAAPALAAARAIHSYDLDREIIAEALREVKAIKKWPEWIALNSTVEKVSRGIRTRKDRFIKANLRLVISMAKRYNYKASMPMADLIQEGNIGLIKAVDRFDHARGYRFSTYASWWIRHAITRGIADKGRAVRVPVHMLDGGQKMARVVREMAIEHGHAPSDEEIATATGLPTEKINRLRSLIDSTISMDGVSKAQLEEMASPDTPASIYENGVSIALMREALRTLRPIEAEILRLRFGIDSPGEKTLKEIGDMYDLSRERIRQLQEAALYKLNCQIVKR